MKPEWPALDQIFARGAASPLWGEAAGKESNLQKEIYTGTMERLIETPFNKWGRQLSDKITT